MIRRILPLLAVSFGLASRGATVTGFSRIAPEQVAAAISAAGLHVAAEQIVVPVNAVASTRHPVLKVDGVEHWGDGRLWIRMECSRVVECVPFFVMVQGPERQEDVGVVGREPLDGKEAAGGVMVHPGAFANLVLEGPHIHIRFPVICLGSGRAGDTIRVASKDRRQTFSAEIVGRNELKGTLQ